MKACSLEEANALTNCFKNKYMEEEKKMFMQGHCYWTASST